MDNITIQTLFTAGEHGNAKGIHVENWIKKLMEISPRHVQIYTLDRDYPSDKKFPVAFDWLYELEQKLINLGLKSKAYV